MVLKKDRGKYFFLCDPFTVRKSSLVERQCHSLMRQFVHRVKVATLHTRQFGHRVKVATLQLTPLSVLRDNEKERYVGSLDTNYDLIDVLDFVPNL